MNVTAKVNLISIDFKMVVLAGTVGTIKESNNKSMLIDFGHSALYRLPWDSRLVDIAKSGIIER